MTNPNRGKATKYLFILFIILAGIGFLQQLITNPIDIILYLLVIGGIVYLSYFLFTKKQLPWRELLFKLRKGAFPKLLKRFRHSRFNVINGQKKSPFDRNKR